MKNTANLLLVLLGLFLPATLSAQSGSELRAEADKIYAQADKKLNAAFQKLLKSIKDENEKDRAELLVARLRESQRAWLRYRDAQVSFVAMHANVGSASARAVGMASYGAELTEQRIKDLTTVPNPF